MAPLRWGIASCGKISSDYANAVQHLGSDKHVIVAIASRNKETAAAFAKKFGVAKAYGSVEEMAQDPEIDVVYVGSINTAHLPMCKTLIGAGKPVICEKPLCRDLKQTKELLAYAKEKKVFLMEAMWARCNPVYKEMIARLEKKEVGELVHVHVSFGVYIGTVDRIKFKELGGGATPDIGIYVCNLILAAMGEDMPEDIKTFSKVNEHGVETEVSGTMKFSNNRFATFVLSTSTWLPNKAYITGTKGTIEIGDLFWCPEHLKGPSGEFHALCDPSDRVYNFDNSQLLKHEAEEVAKCLREGLLESPVVPHSLTLKFATLIEWIREEAGGEKYE